MAGKLENKPTQCEKIIKYTSFFRVYYRDKNTIKRSEWYR